MRYFTLVIMMGGENTFLRFVVTLTDVCGKSDSMGFEMLLEAINPMVLTI